MVNNVIHVMAITSLKMVGLSCVLDNLINQHPPTSIHIVVSDPGEVSKTSLMGEFIFHPHYF